MALTAKSPHDLDVPFSLPDVDRLLTTTRTVRRRLDLERPVPPDVVLECIDIACQAPCANAAEKWRWVVVTAPDKRSAIAEYYRLAWLAHSGATKAASARRGRVGHQRLLANRASADWLAQNLHRVPVLVIPCLIGKPPRVRGPNAPATGGHRSMPIGYLEHEEAHVAANSLYYGSIYPAIWSFQLALRSRGLGTAITVAHLPYESQIGQLLGVPQAVTQIALLPVAFTVGLKFQRANRVDVSKVVHWDKWDGRPSIASDEIRLGPASDSSDVEGMSCHPTK